jgi:phosphoenolpyruvate---glycerone phosphotransferase subunit DhaK
MPWLGPWSRLVNGLGATATMEQYILYRAARLTLEELGASVSRSYVGEFITSLEMAGASITIMVLDDELRGLLDAPARAVALTR